MRAVVSGLLLVLLGTACDAVLKLEEARPRAETTRRQPSIEPFDAGGEGPDSSAGPIASCTPVGGDCSAAECCTGAVCSPTEHHCVAPCQGPADCESACCMTPS